MVCLSLSPFVSPSLNLHSRLAPEILQGMKCSVFFLCTFFLWLCFKDSEKADVYRFSIYFPNTFDELMQWKVLEWYFGRLLQVLLVCSNVLVTQWCQGKPPFLDVHPLRVIAMVSHEGYRLPIPKECPSAINALIEKCWLADSAERPSFANIITILDNVSPELLEQM